MNVIITLTITKIVGTLKNIKYREIFTMEILYVKLQNLFSW